MLLSDITVMHWCVFSHQTMPSRKTVISASSGLWMKSLKHLVVFSSLCCLISGYSERERVHDLMSRYPLIDG